MVQFTKLRLTGFKSFVEATDVDIGQGLTGVVGPNGCGKSNLVEALRWAMGENSPKRMRSSGMDDVIFAGTEQRPARNTAEVLLYLDNADRTAPAEINDSDELVVSRKIERDVGSTYKVNGKNVRMRDVQLLFADSSIGSHSPALVSQGRVSDMINAKPTQRRMVLEEAAGISGLHARRHEAELKLKAAETNLLRVEDVLGAMNVQLEGLKKQARQASRYRNLQGHIQTAEGSLLWLKWQDSRTTVGAALQAFEAAENIVRDRMLVVTELTTKQTEAAARVPELRQDEAVAAAALQRLKLAYGSLETEERQVNEDRARSETLLAQFRADVAHENTQKQEARDGMERLKAERETLASEAQSQAERETEAGILRDEIAAGVEKLEAGLTELTEDVAQRDAWRNEAERRVNELARRETQLTEKQADLETRHAALLAATPAKAELDALGPQIAGAEESYAAASAHFDGCETARAQAETLQQEKSDRLQAAQKEHAQLSAEAEALRRILRTAQEAYQPVIDLLAVDPGFEKALAVAFGDELQAALDGAAPTYWRELPDYATPPALPAAARPLSQCVRGPRALNRILSQIGVVATAAEAESLVEALQPGQCLVTADGGAWRWDGLTVSPLAENAGAIRLQQKNRLSELETALVAAGERLETARAESQSAREARSGAIEALQAARQAFRDAEEALNGLRRRQTALGNQLAEVTAKLTSLSAAIDATRQDKDAASQQLAEARETFAAMPDTVDARAKIAESRTVLTTERQKLADQQAVHADLRREGETRARRLGQIDGELVSWQGRVERIDLRVIELEDRIRQAADVLERLAERPAQIEREKQDLLSHISEAETKRQQAADVLVSAETAANDLARDLRAAESSLADARETRALAQGGVNTAQLAQNGIEASIQEKFTCLPEEMVTKLELKTEELSDIGSWQGKLDRLVRERENMGPVNLRAEVESQEISEKMQTLQAERDDLVAAIGKLREGINTLNKEARTRLLSAFDTVNTHFQKLFTRLFNGGQAYLKLIEADDPLESGLEIFAQPPGKKLSVLSLLSGGEQTLTSIALIFAMFLTNPAPICVLDEVDAPLDESNVDRYCTLLEDLAKDGKTRFLVITHHRMTMARMDRLYGVTMSEKGVSQLVSVDLKQHELQLEQAA